MTWRVRILTAESMGVRGLCTVVERPERKVLIDPGIALGYRRYGLKPHPFQIGVGRVLRRKILREAGDATDIVFSHYHGDHIPLLEANPYQLSLEKALSVLKGKRLWGLDPEGLSSVSRQRARDLADLLPLRFVPAEGFQDRDMVFLPKASHGELEGPGGWVLMTLVGRGFLHASDIQLLNDDSVGRILALKPEIVVAAGPPLYLPQMTCEMRQRARGNAHRLGDVIPRLVLDHHLLRSQEGLSWLKEIDQASANSVTSAAGFMGRRARLLEARRKEFYRRFPVPDGWHEAYEASYGRKADQSEPKGASGRFLQGPFA